MIPRIISVSNLKGGAGKSTIAVNVACAIRAATGIDTILVDADRQATALKWAETGSLGLRVTSRVLHEAKPEERHPGLMWVTQIRMLADKNASVVIDLPPGLEFSLAAVAAISDMILVPVNPSGVDFHSTSAFINLVQKTRQIRNSDKPRSIIVPNRLDRRTAIARKMSLYEQFGEPISPAIGMRSAFVYAFDHGQWVGDFAPRSVAHKEIENLVSFIMSSADDKTVAAPLAADPARRAKKSAPAAAAVAVAPSPSPSPVDVMAEGEAAAALADVPEDPVAREAEPVPVVGVTQDKGEAGAELTVARAGPASEADADCADEDDEAGQIGASHQAGDQDDDWDRDLENDTEDTEDTDETDDTGGHDDREDDDESPARAASEARAGSRDDNEGAEVAPALSEDNRRRDDVRDYCRGIG